jgi:hypothetical protein
MTRNANSAGEAIQRAREAILRAAGQLAGLSPMPADYSLDLTAWARELSACAARLADEAKTLAEAMQAIGAAPSHSSADGH